MIGLVQTAWMLTRTQLDAVMRKNQKLVSPAE